MICPKCGSNNPKDPLQCIRCGYIFPEYIKAHDIDMNRTTHKKTEEEKRADAIMKFNMRNKPAASRTPIVNNGYKPGTVEYNEVLAKQNVQVENLSNTQTNIPQVPTKIKKIRFIGRNGINRIDDLQECLATTIEFCCIVCIIYLLINFLPLK